MRKLLSIISFMAIVFLCVLSVSNVNFTIAGEDDLIDIHNYKIIIQEKV